MSHTPGPWTYAKNERVVGPSGNTIADCRYKNGRHDGPLVAAAPELLEALRLLREIEWAVSIDCNGEEREAAWTKARAAIAKVEGQ
jgi:hypothetical protein